VIGRTSKRVPCPAGRRATIINAQTPPAPAGGRVPWPSVLKWAGGMVKLGVPWSCVLTGPCCRRG
jgi:hypothetical protein